MCGSCLVVVLENGRLSPISRRIRWASPSSHLRDETLLCLSHNGVLGVLSLSKKLHVESTHLPAANTTGQLVAVAYDGTDGHLKTS